MPGEQPGALVDDADGGQVRLCGRAPPGPLLICCSLQGGWAMRTLMESLRLLLAKIRRLVTGQR